MKGKIINSKLFNSSRPIRKRNKTVPLKLSLLSVIVKELRPPKCYTLRFVVPILERKHMVNPTFWRYLDRKIVN